MGLRMRVVLIALAITAFFALVAAQPPAPTAPYVAAIPKPDEPPVYFHPRVRTQLQRAWDSTDASQPERAYCLEAVRIRTNRGDSAWMVLDASKQIPTSDSPESVNFGCGSKPSLHTHPPTTCSWLAGLQMWSCVLGGRMAFIHYASLTDLRSVAMSQAPFGIIQWDANRFTVYYDPERVRK